MFGFYLREIIEIVILVDQIFLIIFPDFSGCCSSQFAHTPPVFGSGQWGDLLCRVCPKNFFDQRHSQSHDFLTEFAQKTKDWFQARVAPGAFFPPVAKCFFVELALSKPTKGPCTRYSQSKPLPLLQKGHLESSDRLSQSRPADG